MLQLPLIQKCTKKASLRGSDFVVHRQNNGNSKPKATNPSSVVSPVKRKLCEAVGPGLLWNSVTTLPHGVCSASRFRSDGSSITKLWAAICKAACVSSHRFRYVVSL